MISLDNQCTTWSWSINALIIYSSLPWDSEDINWPIENTRLPLNEADSKVSKSSIIDESRKTYLTISRNASCESCDIEWSTTSSVSASILFFYLSVLEKYHNSSIIKLAFNIEEEKQRIWYWWIFWNMCDYQHGEIIVLEKIFVSLFFAFIVCVYETWFP